MVNRRKGIKKNDNDTYEEEYMYKHSYICNNRVCDILLRSIVLSFCLCFVFTIGVIIRYYVTTAMTFTKLPRMNMDTYWGTFPMDQEPDTSIKPYKIEFSDVMINDLRERLLHQRQFQPPLERSGFRYGFNSDYLMKVLDYWKNDYDFKGREAVFNKYNHYVTNIEGLDIHYMHVKPVVSTDVKVLTLLLLHSWPGSVREFYELIPKLTFPNPKYKFVFEVIAPSLPGCGFSQAPTRDGMVPGEMAIVIAKLMERIGHTTYYVHGGDIGHEVGSALATIFPENVLGFHTSTPRIHHSMTVIDIFLDYIFPTLTSDDGIPIEKCSFCYFMWRLFDETGYLHLQSTKPDTIGIALTDSPAGLAAYMLEKFSLLTNAEYQDAEDGNIRNKFSLTQLLDHVMVYWVTNSITTSMRIHAQFFHPSYFNLDSVITKVPTWGIKFRNYLDTGPETTLRRKYTNYLQTTYVNDGGSFAAMEHPKLLVNDIFAAVDTFIAFHNVKGLPLKVNSNCASSQENTPIVPKQPETVYDFSVTDIHGKEVNLIKYRGYVLLIVNVASECGLTMKNYEQLNELYDEYERQGLRILAFPCNQFGSQEPGSSEDIINFTKTKGIRFDLFSKVEVNGDDAHPLWKFLKQKQSGTLGEWIKWNFSKFIVDSYGVPVERFGPNEDPLDLKPFIDKYIRKKTHEDL